MTLDIRTGSGGPSPGVRYPHDDALSGEPINSQLIENQRPCRAAVQAPSWHEALCPAGHPSRLKARSEG
ncbi:hypothetical protein [Nonomuraea insulae]|uniref:Uncharacterized protein n=1 Tax=Nonomuraea insulae TaxID=1616787 RepID=A0ABW1DBD6_9ACTN